MSFVFDWLFRNRVTGEITIAQTPNAPLVVWFGAAMARRLFHATSSVDSVLTVVSGAALIFWAGDEVLRGVNPFRRMLGASVLGWEALRLLTAAA